MHLDLKKETEDKEIKHFAFSALCQHNLKRLANVKNVPTVTEVHQKRKTQ